MWVAGMVIVVSPDRVPPQTWIVIHPAETTGMKPAGTRIFIASAHAITHADSAR